MNKREILLTPEERLKITEILEDVDKLTIIRYYTFSESDIKIINNCRGSHNKIGFALQLGILRHKGWTLKNSTVIPKSILEFVCKQLNIKQMEYHYYFQVPQTNTNHLDEIRKKYNYTYFNDESENCYLEKLKIMAVENEEPLFLVEALINYLREQNIIVPGITKLEKIVAKALIQFENEIYSRINRFINNKQRDQLEELLSVNSDKKTTVLAWLRDDNGKSSPEELLATTNKIKKIKEINLTIDLKGIPYKKIEFFIRIGKRYEPFSFRRFETDKRYAILALFLLDLHQVLIDKIITIHDIRINSVFSSIKRSQSKIIKNQSKNIKESMNELLLLGRTLINAKKNKKNIEKIIEKEITWESFEKTVADGEKILKNSKTDTFEMLNNYYSNLRKYTPTLLKTIDFKSSNSSCNELMKTLEVIKRLNENNKTILPEELELELNFVNKKWKNLIEKKTGAEKRHYLEIAAFNELKNKLRSGDIFVSESKNYRDFENYLFSKSEWNRDKEKTRLSVSLDVEKYFESREIKLNKLLKWYSINYDEVINVIKEDDKIHLKRQEKSTPEEAKQLSINLYKLIPKIALHDLLFEVFKITDLYEAFAHAADKKNSDRFEYKELLVFAIMGIGTNVGLSKIAESLNNISYKQLANIADWHIYEENLVKADGIMTNFQRNNPFAHSWGDGTTSSSDGMRMKTGVETTNASHNPHFGFEKGLTIYRFICDMYSAFYNSISGPNDRDGIHVIDGLLKHKSDLQIKEHYTDTAGYTDQVFALMPLMGFNFAPRLRNLPDLKLYTFDSNKFPKLKKLVTGVINKKVISDKYDDVLRLAHSIFEKKVSSQLILKKLGSYSRNNSLANALKEMGKIEKTIFILEYASDKELRKRIQIGLNKGEEMNGMARAVFFGKRGQFWEHELQKQLQKSSCLNIILNAIVIWNTIYLKKAWEYYKKNNPNADEKLLTNISPLNWEHINFLGEYTLELEVFFEEDNLRKLNI